MFSPATRLISTSYPNDQWVERGLPLEVCIGGARLVGCFGVAKTGRPTTEERIVYPTQSSESGTVVTVTTPRIYGMSFAKVYPLYVAKAEKKGRTQAEVDEILFWLTGYSKDQLDTVIDEQTNFEAFFGQAPLLNPSRAAITGVVCGVRVENIEEPTMREIRYLDKLIDELAKGADMQKILRSSSE